MTEVAGLVTNFCKPHLKGCDAAQPALAIAPAVVKVLLLGFFDGHLGAIDHHIKFVVGSEVLVD